MFFHFLLFSDALESWVLADIGGAPLCRVTYFLEMRRLPSSPNNLLSQCLHLGPPSTRPNEYGAKYGTTQSSMQAQNSGRLFKPTSSESAYPLCLGFLTETTTKAIACVSPLLPQSPDQQLIFPCITLQGMLLSRF